MGCQHKKCSDHRVVDGWGALRVNLVVGNDGVTSDLCMYADM
jgi:hypothetical protein